MTDFALRTSDSEWIARHAGQIDAAGRVHVMVSEVEQVTFAGKSWLRHQFSDVPADYPNGAVMCLEAWVQ